MSSIGEINGRGPDTNPQDERLQLPVIVYFGVFFDGTGNNMIQSKRAKAVKKKLDKYDDSELSREQLLESHQGLQLSDNGANSIAEEITKDEDNDFSNIAVLHNSYFCMSEQQRESLEEKYKVYLYNIYVQGAGTNEVWTDTKDAIGLGFGTGRAGVAALVAKAMNLVNIVVKGLQINPDFDNQIYFDVFGFSRGATCARMFSHLVNGDLALTRSYKELATLKKTYLSQFKKNKRKVAFLGIYDTVSSIGITYDNNNVDYGLYSPNEDWVEHTFHICALDEFRDHFRLTDVGNSVNKNSLEIYLPGCHSDIGGGYNSDTQGSMTEVMRIKYALKIVNPDSADLMDLQNHFMPSVKTSTVPICMYKHINDYQPNPISIEWLTELGWYDDTNKDYKFWDDSFNCILNITRQLSRGYSNISLDLMMGKANKVTERDMFRKTKESRFAQIADDLSTFRSMVESKIGGVNSGKLVIIPSATEYQHIRSHYLHFSANDSLVLAWKKTAIVNAPTISNRSLNRIVYHGNDGDTSQTTLYKSPL